MLKVQIFFDDDTNNHMYTYCVDTTNRLEALRLALDAFSDDKNKDDVIAKVYIFNTSDKHLSLKEN